MAQNNRSHFLSSRICNLDRAQSGKLISAPQRLWSQLRRLEDEGVTARGHHMRARSLTCPAVEAASQRGPELGHFVAFWWGLAFLRARRLCSQMSSQDKEPGGSGATFGPSLYRIITPRLPSSNHPATNPRTHPCIHPPIRTLTRPSIYPSTVYSSIHPFTYLYAS